MHRMPRRTIGFGLLACAALAGATLALPDVARFLGAQVASLRVTVRNPSDPMGLDVTLTLPMEGRMQQAQRGMTILVAPAGVTAPVAFEDLASDAGGTVRVTMSKDVFVPDGTDVLLVVKTQQTLQRIVRGTASRATVRIDLGDPSTYHDVDGANLRGIPYLPAGDIEGSGGPLHDNVIDAFDIGAWARSFSARSVGAPADLDGNGSVGAEDLSLLLGNYNSRGDTVASLSFSSSIAERH